jgi:hypothetical protein
LDVIQHQISDTIDLDPASGVQNTITTPEGKPTYDTTTGVVTFDPALNFKE